MNILLLGSGGREHAIALKISESPRCKKLFIAPGNAGTSNCGENLNLNLNDFKSIQEAVLKHAISLVIVGPEEPLVNGIVDFFQKENALKNILIVGPSAEGSKLEGSKDFAKKFMKEFKIPTASYNTFNRQEATEAKKFLTTLNPPYVIKADGLAGGKGVIICNTIAEANKSVDEMLQHDKFGKAAEKIVIEEFLNGIELSVFVLTDGHSYKILPEAKDYKRIGENDTGLNTGGMGAVSPVPFAGKEFMKKVEQKIIIPTIEGLIKRKIYYRGFVFIGLMNVDGEPYVIEYNVRMGDPETEVVFPRIQSDVVELLQATGTGKLSDVSLVVNPQTALTVMMVSGGYPESFEKGKEITFEKDSGDVYTFHAGTIFKEGKVYSDGGRVLAVTSFGNTIQAAREKSYAKLERIKFENGYFRKDIGLDLIKPN